MNEVTFFVQFWEPHEVNLSGFAQINGTYFISTGVLSIRSVGFEKQKKKKNALLSDLIFKTQHVL